MKGVLAHEVDGGKVESGAAGCAAGGGEGDGFGGQFGEFGALGGCVGAECRGEAAVLKRIKNLGQVLAMGNS